MSRSEIVRSERKARKMTQQAFADMLGVNKSTVIRWEKGNGPVPEAVMLLIGLWQTLRGFIDTHGAQIALER